MITDLDFGLAANETKTIYTVGSFIRYKVGTVDVRVEPPNQGRVSLSQGHKIRYADRFTQLDITNTTAGAITGTLTIGDGDFQDDRINGAVTITGTTTVNHARGSMLSVLDVICGPAARTTVAAAASTRREIAINNLASNTNTVRIGDVACAANDGIELMPGQTLFLATNSAVYAWNDHATNSVTLAQLAMTD